MMKLEAPLLNWIEHTIPEESQRTFLSLLRRFNTKQQLQEALAFIRFRLAQNVGMGPICIFLTLATRLASVLGQRSLLSATQADMLAVQNVKTWRLENGRHCNKQMTDKSRMRQQREMIGFYAYHWNQPGTGIEGARRKAEELVRPKGLVSLGKPQRQPYSALTPEQAELLLQKIPQMRLSILERVVYTAFIGWAIDNGSRFPSMIRCRVGDVERDADGIVNGIQPPPGPRNKLTARLAAGPHAASLDALLANHPAAKPEAPLFFDPVKFAVGQLTPIGARSFGMFLKRLGRTARLPFNLGSRAFRRLHHNEMAVNGDDDATMRTTHGHHFGSTSPSNYTRLDKDAALRAMRKIRGFPQKVPVCPDCLTTLTSEDVQCPWCKLPVKPAVDAVPWGQDDYQRAEQAGRLGLDSLDTIEGPVDAEGRP